MMLLEKSVIEKQETVTSLRKQLEELKDLNMKMTNQLKASPVVGVAWTCCAQEGVIVPCIAQYTITYTQDNLNQNTD